MFQKLQSITGFTLIEFLIAVSILGIVSAVVMAAINPAQRLADGRDAKRIADAKQIANSLEAYYSIHGMYPHTTEPYGIWERSECDSFGCGMDMPAPFMEYLTPNFFEGTIADPLRGQIDQNPEVWGFLYTPDISTGNQGYCLLVHLENSRNPLLVDDDPCDDSFNENWWYALGSGG